MRKPRDIEVTPGKVLQQFTADEAAAFAAQWLDIFAKLGRGMNTKAFMWHVFSGGRFPCLEGKRAKEAYAQQAAAEYVVLSNDRAVAFLTDQLPEACSLSDFYVFPSNFAWTMAFTHEVGWLGPYFAKHPQYEKLEAENQAKIRKAREAAAARRKGWT